MAASLARPRPVLLFLLLLLLLFSATVATAQVPPPPPPPSAPAASRDAGKVIEGTAILKGQVVSPAGEPIKRATVTLSAGSPGESPRAMTTDAEGRFEFQRVRSGRLSLAASKMGYVTTGIGAKRPGGPSRPIEVAEGATLENANITLAPGCAISGRLLDEYGDPVSDAYPRLLKFRFTQGRRQLATVTVPQPERSNDLGEFRVFGLAPGDYYLAVAFRPLLLNSTPDSNNTGYAPTYYPGTANQGEAARIACGVGQEVRLNDLTLVTVPTVNVSGTVRTSAGKLPPGYTSISLHQAGANAPPAGSAALFASNQPDGGFMIADVAPGDYVLQVQVNGGEEGAVVPLSVARSVTGLSVTTSKAGIVSGRILADTGLTLNLPMTQVQLGLTPLEPDARRLSFGGSDRVREDGTFELSGLNGVFTLRSTAPGWHLKALRLNGADVTDTGVPFRFNGDVAGLEVVLTNRSTTLSGVVRDERETTVHDYAALAFPEDPAKWHWNSRYLQMARPDQSGTFRFQDLAPGRYLVAAVREVEPDEWTDPEILERLRERATRVTVVHGDTKTVQLTLIEEKR